MLLFIIHSWTSFCFWFVRPQSYNFHLTFFKLTPALHRPKVFRYVLIFCFIHAYYLIIVFIYIYIYIYICIYIYIINIIQNLQICYLKLLRHEWRFSSNTKTLYKVLDKVRDIVVATNCHLSFTSYPMGLLYKWRGETCFHGGISKRAWTFC